MIDLWPDHLGAAGGRAPAAILREQARHLESRTGEMLTGRIEPSYLPKGTARKTFGSEEELFMYEFHLEAPVLDYYHRNLLTIVHGISLYPVFVHTDETIKKELSGDVLNITANNEDEFLDILNKIFSSEKTVTIINSILTQVKGLVSTPNT